MDNPSQFFGIDCEDPKGLLQRAYEANNTKPGWLEGFNSGSAILTIVGVGLVLNSHWLWLWTNQFNIYYLAGGIGHITAG